MFKKKFLVSILIFSFLLFFTSFVKTKTRLIEKKISNVEKIILTKNKDLHEIQLDYFYLVSPSNLTNKIKKLDIVDYQAVDFSRIYLSLSDFIVSHKNLTNLKNTNEEIQKK